MEKEEALAIIDNVCSQITSNRETHLKIIEAIEVLKKAIAPEIKDKKE
ncbi:MAG: hypothetical protein WCX48_08755 [Bacteroidales bacterium]